MISNDINLAVQHLNKNGIIGFPTETVYGLAGNAFNTAAIHKIFDVKKRPTFNPLIVHIKGIEDLDKVATDIPSIARGQLNELKSQLKVAASTTPDRLTKFHLNDLVARIENAMKPK